MTKRWRYATLDEISDLVSVRGHQAQKTKYMDAGKWPIIDQGQSEIVGYTEDHEPICGPFPLVLFGDHTRIVKLINQPFVVGADGVKLLAAKRKEVEPNYLHVLVTTAASQIPSLGYARHFRSLKQVALPIPPLPEQKRIAEILGACDEAIEAQERLIAQKQERKKGLMQRLLTGKIRFPQFAGKPWKEVRLGDIFKERKESKREELDLLSVTGTGGVVKRDDLDRKDTSSEDKSNYKRVCCDDIAYNTMRMWQGVSGLSSYEGIVSPAYTVVTPTESMDPIFSSYLFKLSDTVSLFHRYSQGLVDDTLSLKYRNFKVIKVTIPGRQEQEAIAAILSVQDEEIDLQQQKLEQLKQQKQGLMQRLLTGKVRVKV